MKATYLIIIRFIKQSVTENLQLKMIAAVVSILLYGLVLFQEESEGLIDYDIERIDPSPLSSLVITSEFPDTVRVRLRGPRSIINSLKQENLRPIKVDLSNRKGGTSYYYFSEEHFNIPPVLKFIRVTPESVQIKMERRISRQLPMRVKTYGKLARGTELPKAPEIDPSLVTAIGTESSLRGLKAIETEDIDIEGLGVGKHEMMVLPRRIEGVTLKQDEKIKISMVVQWIMGQRMFSGLPVLSKGSSLPVEIKPKEVTVTLNGPKVELEKISPSQVQPFAILEESESGRPGIYRSKALTIDLPNGITVTSIVPKSVQVKLTRTMTAKQKKVSQPAQ
jgi:YbbR domain-containing protein